jgi:hypothetical protein
VIVVPRPLPRPLPINCYVNRTQLLDRDGQAVARGSCLSQVLDRGAQAAARGAVPCWSQVLDRGSRLLLAAPLVVRRTYLAVVLRSVLRPLSAESLEVASVART